MARVLLAAEDNHKITLGEVTGPARATLKRIGDPIFILDDGQTHGRKIEDTVFSHSPSWGGMIGEPGTPHDEWRHPTTDDPMTVNPMFWIVEMLIVPPADPAFQDLLDPEFETVEVAPGIFQDNLKQKRKWHLVTSGTFPNTLTPPEYAELLATHRLRLTRGRAIPVFQLWPEPS